MDDERVIFTIYDFGDSWYTVRSNDDDYSEHNKDWVLKERLVDVMCELYMTIYLRYGKSVLFDVDISD